MCYFISRWLRCKKTNFGLQLWSATKLVLQLLLHAARGRIAALSLFLPQHFLAISTLMMREVGDFLPKWTHRPLRISWRRQLKVVVPKGGNSSLFEYHYFFATLCFVPAETRESVGARCRARECGEKCHLCHGGNGRDQDGLGYRKNKSCEK